MKRARKVILGVVLVLLIAAAGLYFIPTASTAIAGEWMELSGGSSEPESRVFVFEDDAAREWTSAKSYLASENPYQAFNCKQTGGEVAVFGGADGSQASLCQCSQIFIRQSRGFVGRRRRCGSRRPGVLRGAANRRPKRIDRRLLGY